jgi:hypothetical protein
MKPTILEPRPEYLQFLLPYGPATTKLALATRALVLEEAPGATELIYDAYSAVATGYSFTGRPGDACVHIAVYPKWVNLGFNRGSALNDPEGLLTGSGRWIRHIRISTEADLQRPAVRKLVKAAVKQVKRTKTRADATAGATSVVRAVYAKRRRPARMPDAS